MNHEEFCEKYKNPIGMSVWICVYKLNNKSDIRPTRVLKPIYVKVVSNKELPKNKRIYYSNFHFRPINKQEKVLKKIIPPFDNTGWRFSTGTSVNIFINQKECIECFNKQCDTAIKEYKNKIKAIEDRIQDIQNLKYIKGEM